MEVDVNLPFWVKLMPECHTQVIASDTAAVNLLYQSANSKMHKCVQLCCKGSTGLSGGGLEDKAINHCNW